MQIKSGVGKAVPSGREARRVVGLTNLICEPPCGEPLGEFGVRPTSGATFMKPELVDGERG